MGATNIRNTAFKHWRRWLGQESRGVVPFASFFENAALATRHAGGVDLRDAFDFNQNCRPIAENRPPRMQRGNQKSSKSRIEAFSRATSDRDRLPLTA